MYDLAYEHEKHKGFAQLLADVLDGVDVFFWQEVLDTGKQLINESVVLGPSDQWIRKVGQLKENQAAKEDEQMTAYQTKAGIRLDSDGKNALNTLNQIYGSAALLGQYEQQLSFFSRLVEPVYNKNLKSIEENFTKALSQKHPRIKQVLPKHYKKVQEDFSTDDQSLKAIDLASKDYGLWELAQMHGRNKLRDLGAGNMKYSIQNQGSRAHEVISNVIYCLLIQIQAACSERVLEQQLTKALQFDDFEALQACIKACPYQKHWSLVAHTVQWWGEQKSPEALITLAQLGEDKMLEHLRDSGTELVRKMRDLLVLTGQIEAFSGQQLVDFKDAYEQVRQQQYEQIKKQAAQASMERLKPKV